jgi:dipeptidyl aminopeptidase/acylaminoacyl peptidase
MKNKILGFSAFALALLITLPAASQVTKADYERVDTLMNNSKRVYNAAVAAHWIGNTHRFWYQNHERGGDKFYIVDAATEKKNIIARHELERMGEKIEQPVFDPYAEYEQPEFKNDSVLSPDKQHIAYIKDFNLYVSEPGSKTETALSMDGMQGLYYGGRIVWSPDSKKIALLKIRPAEGRQIPLRESSPASQKQPILKWIHYDKPGDVLTIQVPVLFDVEKGKQIPLATSLYENQFNLRMTGWRSDSRAFTFEFNQRGHQRYIVGEVEASDGTIRHLVDEQCKTFIYYDRLFRYDLNDGREMLWISERDGWRHLYMIDCASGNVKNQITKGEWVVRNVEYVDESGKMIYFMASGFNAGEDPYNMHYCRIHFDGTGFTDMTPENGNHEVTPSKDHQYFADVCSRPDMPPVSSLRRISDGRKMELERCDISSLLAEGWKMPEVFHAKGRDGKTDIWGTIFRPSHFDPNKSYPIVEQIYAGPHDSYVYKNFLPAHKYCTPLADLGFIVVMIDGMGTANRSKAFHDVCWKNLKDAGFPDRIAWMKAAAEKYPYMDTTRVGIWGRSAGGQNALAALLFHNEFYKVAVSLCGCHDNRMDKIWWNEQWMGYPIDESYSASSNVDNAWRLKGKLFLINGELDDNVDPASTLQVVKALMDSGKNFEQLYLPGQGHPLYTPFILTRIHDFLVKNLLHQDPPEW